MLNHTAKSKPNGLVSWSAAAGQHRMPREGAGPQMPDIVMSCNIDADAETVWRAITTTDGVTGWFTGHAQIEDGARGHPLLTCPEKPDPRAPRLRDSAPAARLRP